MITLQQLQKALQAHVLDGAMEIAGAIDSSPEVSADVRLGVYSDAYRLRLIEALAGNFPVLSQVLDRFDGEGAFDKLTQLYLAAHPSRHFSIRWFGDRLSEFLAQVAEYADRSWLAELAQWEWHVAAAFDAADATVLAVEDLGSVAPEDWPAMRFEVHPSVRRMTVTTDFMPVLKASQSDDALPQPKSECAAAEWLIYRKDLVVEYRSMAASEAKAFEAARDGATFGEICELLADYFAEDEVPLHAASYLKQWTMDHCLARTRS
jgi:hypothetical protein